MDWGCLPSARFIFWVWEAARWGIKQGRKARGKVVEESFSKFQGKGPPGHDADLPDPSWQPSERETNNWGQPKMHKLEVLG